MTLPAPAPLFSRPVSRIHCVGVAGMGLGPLAIYLAKAGYQVSGEDDAPTPEILAHLATAGVTLGGIPEDCDLVVYSSAIAKQHPAYVAAIARALPLVRRGELLAEVVRGKKLVAICGSHGKTTTTAMLATILRKVDFPGGYVLGGLFNDASVSPARFGEGEWIVAEIDESDGTIGSFSPEITVAVNLDWDHPDHYRTQAELEAAFAGLFGRTQGTVIVSESCTLSAKVGPGAMTFGVRGDFSARVESESRTGLTLQLGGRFEAARVVLNARGDFNATNATAAMAAAQLMGADLLPTMLADYPGVRRRQSVLHSTGDLTVIEDYAHHPAEIRALLASLRQRVMPGGRLVVAFQPHRFSRTAQFKTEFAAALMLADSVHLLDVYGAGETAITGGTTADVLAELKINGSTVPSVHALDDKAFFSALSADVKPRDLLVFVGAGDIDRKARAWLDLLTAPLETSPWDEFFTAVRPHLPGEMKFRREEPLAGKTTMRVGGAARLYAEPTSVGSLQILLREARARHLEIFVIGRGSNLVVPDGGVDGLVISLAHEAWATFEPKDSGRVWAGAGLRLKNLCGLAAKAGLVGFEFLEGIPGNIGGALRMNAGAMGGWMFDVVEEVQLITLEGDVLTLPRSAMHVDYRHCEELHHAIALGALLRPASAADANAINRQIDTYRKKRQESQPREPSAGCIFKNPPGNSAGRLIDESGLKGMRVGDAEVSAVHANFIINRGRATSADVIELVRRVRAGVKQAKGVELEPEVLLYGSKWKDVL